MVRVGCKVPLKLWDKIWAKNTHFSDSMWREVVLSNSNYGFCGDAPFAPRGGDLVICRSCAVKKGLAW